MSTRINRRKDERRQRLESRQIKRDRETKKQASTMAVVQATQAGKTARTGMQERGAASRLGKQLESNKALQTMRSKSARGLQGLRSRSALDLQSQTAKSVAGLQERRIDASAEATTTADIRGKESAAQSLAGELYKGGAAITDVAQVAGAHEGVVPYAGLSRQPRKSTEKFKYIPGQKTTGLGGTTTGPGRIFSESTGETRLDPTQLTLEELKKRRLDEEAKLK